MLTVHLITFNNARTIRPTLESICALKPRIIVSDLGSTDETPKICSAFKAEVISEVNIRRDQIRNRVTAEAPGMVLRIEPWETVVKGHRLLMEKSHGMHYVSILNQKMLSKDIRLVDKNTMFEHPIFERPAIRSTKSEIDVLLLSSGSLNNKFAVEQVEKWRAEKPLLSEPYYYEACLALEVGNYDKFLSLAEHYLFMNRDLRSVPTTMVRYYFAMVQLMHTRKVRPALQNLSLCLSANPLMAEFWCLMGDVYYHLLSKFGHAREFYENALLLGGRRLKTDLLWPMDISKYNEYPKKMIASCDEIGRRAVVYDLGTSTRTDMNKT